MVDVVVGHRQGALEDQRLEHGRIEPPVGLGMVRERRVGDPRVLQRQHERLLEVGVDVADLHRASWQRHEVGRVRERLDLEVASQRQREASC